MPYISYSGYKSAHGRPSGDVIRAGKWEDIPHEVARKVDEASQDLMKREAGLDIEMVANKVSSGDWSAAVAKAVTDIDKLADKASKEAS